MRAASSQRLLCEQAPPPKKARTQAKPKPAARGAGTKRTCQDMPMTRPGHVLQARGKGTKRPAPAQSQSDEDFADSDEDSEEEEESDEYDESESEERAPITPNHPTITQSHTESPRIVRAPPSSVIHDSPVGGATRKEEAGRQGEARGQARGEGPVGAARHQGVQGLEALAGAAG